MRIFYFTEEKDSVGKWSAFKLMSANDTTEIFHVSLCKTFRSASESMKCVQQRLPHFMSLISIAQRETWNISVVSFVNKGSDADLLALLILAVSFPTARRVRNLHPFAACALCCRHILAPSAVACDKLHLRASAHYWHVSFFLCNREFQEISYYTKKAVVTCTGEPCNCNYGFWIFGTGSYSSRNVLPSGTVRLSNFPLFIFSEGVCSG